MAVGHTPGKLPSPCMELNYLSIRINMNDTDENLAALCLLRSSPSLQELEILVSFSPLCLCLRRCLEPRETDGKEWKIIIFFFSCLVLNFGRESNFSF